MCQVCKLRDTTNGYNTLKSILYTAWSGNAATTFGQDQESVSDDMYRDYISENYVGACIKELLHPGLLSIDESPELAAFPVGMPQLIAQFFRLRYYYSIKFESHVLTKVYL